MKHYNNESFNLDHEAVEAPYIRLVSRKNLGRRIPEPGEPAGNDDVIITKFDIRFTQPNEKFIPNDALHSLEHLVAEYMRDQSSNVIDFSPMGCRTGFYLIMAGDYTIEQIRYLFTNTLSDILSADAVPGCSEKACGNYREHDLDGAKLWAARFLSVEPQKLLRVFKTQ